MQIQAETKETELPKYKTDVLHRHLQWIE